MKGEGTKEYILRKAAELFRHFGFYKTAIDDIANEAKVGKGTIYYYFKSKYELFGEVLLRESLRLLSLLKTAVGDAGEEPEERVLRASIAHIRHLRMNPLFIETLSDEKLLAIPDISGAISKFRRNISLFFKELLSSCKSNSKENCEQISTLLTDLLTTIALSPPHIADDLSEENIEIIVRSMIKGV